MPAIPVIGRCIGCDRASRLDDGVCEACLTRRGRRWAEMSSRCRRDVGFALAVYASIATDRGRMLFLELYGPGLLRVGMSSPCPNAPAPTGKPSEEEELRPPPPGRATGEGEGDA